MSSISGGVRLGGSRAGRFADRDGRSGGRSRLDRRVRGHANHESAPPAGPRTHLHRAPVQLGDLPDQGEPEARPTMCPLRGGIDLVEAFEDQPELVLGYPRTVVPDDRPQGIGSARRDGPKNVFATREAVEIVDLELEPVVGHEKAAGPEPEEPVSRDRQVGDVHAGPPVRDVEVVDAEKALGRLGRCSGRRGLKESQREGRAHPGHSAGPRSAHARPPLSSIPRHPEGPSRRGRKYACAQCDRARDSPTAALARRRPLRSEPSPDARTPDGGARSAPASPSAPAPSRIDDGQIGTLASGTASPHSALHIRRPGAPPSEAAVSRPQEAYK